MDNSEAYRRVYLRIRDLVKDPGVTEVDVPTCPGWTVKDLIGHLAAFFTVARTADDPGKAFGPDWGDKEVAARKDRSLQECLDEWETELEKADEMFGSHLGPVVVSDALAHEQDIRTALDEPGARDDANIVPAVEMALSFAEHKAKGAGVPALRVVTPDIDRQLGEGEASATLRTSTFELFRAIQGRRTTDQVRSLDWDGDPEPWLDIFFIFGPTEQVVEESTA